MQINNLYRHNNERKKTLLFTHFIAFYRNWAFTYHKPNEDWPEYLGGLTRNHFSTLNQITIQNASQLKLAWTYSMPDSGQMQSNPLVIKGILYGISSTVQTFALDAATGKEIWRFGDPLKHWSATSRELVSGPMEKKNVFYSQQALIYGHWMRRQENQKLILEIMGK
jgi:hypothetical protein